MEKKCFHCGDNLPPNPILKDEKNFCCVGCSNVYSLLKDHQLGDFYNYEQQPGTKPIRQRIDKFNFLDIPEIRKRFIQFENEKMIRVTLSLPTIHCSSCIYLLENAQKINSGIINCQVHFAKKEAIIVYDPNQLKLSELATFLSHIGYEPNFGKKENRSVIDKTFLLKIGIAGFAFGSIMLWSAPEYFGIEKDNQFFRNFTSYLSFAISIPVLVYSANEYFISAFKALRSKVLNLDVPITIGIIALYAQSAYSIFKNEGPGYMDSFSGFIFFLLIGKWFQSVSYRSLSFDRDYSSYFPVAVTKITKEKDEIIPIEELEQNDVILIRNEEIIPCDSILLSEEAEIDYSFVTGESEPVNKTNDETVFAGGKVIGKSIQLKVNATTDRSQLTQLWNETLNKKKENQLVRYQDRIAQYFLIIILIISLICAGIWSFIDYTMITKVIVSILIVACPCALALSAPFTLGNTMRVFGKSGFYLKNTTVIEAMGEITDLVFDKTGTLTDPNKYEITKIGDITLTDEMNVLATITKNSTHPFSKAIFNSLTNFQELKLSAFTEMKGQGIQAQFNGISYRLGNPNFCKVDKKLNGDAQVYFTKNDALISQFELKSHFREGLKSMFEQLNDKQIHILSGDSEKDLNSILALGIPESHIHFHQTPQDKYNFIEKLKSEGKKVLMTGDGLNDTGALGIADVGIAISEDMFRFTPSSDAILDAKQLIKLPNFFIGVAFSKIVLKVCLAFSITYNIIGLSFATTGALSPIVAAVLMPISSISVVLISTLLVQIRFRKGF
jgi:Cu+-exporting ATPase